MGDKTERKNLDAVDGFAQIVRVMARGFAPTMRLAGYLVRLARVGLMLLVPLTARGRLAALGGAGWRGAAPRQACDRGGRELLRRS